MSGAAIVGAAAIGAGASITASSKASKSSSAALASADAAAQLQYEVSMEQLAFQKEQYANWESIFGPIQENLSNYYQNISSDSIASQGIQALQTSYAQSRQNLDTALAKRGITDSGATVSGLSQLESARMLGKAQIQSQAPMLAAQQQQSFLSGGLGQQSSLISGISNAYGNQANMYGNRYTTGINQSNVYANQAAQAYSGIGSSIGSGINTYMNYQSNQALINSLGTNSGSGGSTVANMTGGWW